MATTREKEPPKNPGPAEIRMTVTRFQVVLAPDQSGKDRGTEYDLKMIKKHPLVYLKKGVIHVRNPGATIRFTIASSPEDKEKYYPAGITFLRESDCNNSDEQRLGLLNFPQRKTRTSGQTLLITDTYRDRKEIIQYKFSVVVQRGSDGKIGIIDPAIGHDNSDVRIR